MKRKDATRVIFKEPFHTIVAYVMPRRSEAEVCMWHEFDVTNVLDYIDEYNRNNNAHLKFFHTFCYALSRTIYHRPKLNYFVKGKKFWKRNDISLSFVAKQQFNDTAEEKLMFLNIKPEMTIKDISATILGDVKKVREEKNNNLDKLMGLVGKMPSFLISLIIWITQTMDYFGCMPSFLMKGDPNYSTALISNLGSIKADAPYHHLNNYGTNSIMIAIGTIKESNNKKVVKVSFTVDERIADGFYFVKSLRYIEYILNNPQELFKEINEAFPEGIIK